MWLLWYRPQRFLLCCLLATKAKNHADKRPKQIVLSQQRIKLVVVLLQDARLLWWGLWKGIQLGTTHTQDTRFVGLEWLWVPRSWATVTQKARKGDRRLQSSVRSFASSTDGIQTFMGCWCSGKGDPFPSQEKEREHAEEHHGPSVKPLQQPQKELYLLRDLQGWICLAEQEE